MVRKLKDQLENSNKELENVKRKLAEQTSVGDRLPQLSRTGMIFNTFCPSQRVIWLYICMRDP